LQVAGMRQNGTRRGMNVGQQKLPIFRRSD
jgi:hypothetical protein